MSDTPRTDEIVAESAARASAERGFGAAMGNLAWYAEALLALARTLERELGEKVSVISETVKWVPVTERLPDPIDSYVLVQGVNPKLYERREFHVCQLWDDDHGYLNHPSEWRWMTEAGNVIDDVTHWMPLPEAPKC